MSLLRRTVTASSWLEKFENDILQSPSVNFFLSLGWKRNSIMHSKQKYFSLRRFQWWVWYSWFKCKCSQPGGNENYGLCSHEVGYLQVTDLTKFLLLAFRKNKVESRWSFTKNQKAVHTLPFISRTEIHAMARISHVQGSAKKWAGCNCTDMGRISWGTSNLELYLLETCLKQ